MTKRFQLPLSDEQRQYLLGLVQANLAEEREFLRDLLDHGHELTTTPEKQTEITEAHVSRATYMVHLLEGLTPLQPREDVEGRSGDQWAEG